MQTCPCNVYPLTHHFYIVKLGFTGVYIFSYFALNIDCGYSCEAVLTCTLNLCFEQKILRKNKKNKLKIVIFSAVKNRCILHGRVFVML